MLSRLAAYVAPHWAKGKTHLSLGFVGVGAYLSGLWFHDEVGTLLVVEGGSMRPTLNPDVSAEIGEKSDICVLWKWRYLPRRGDVVCLYAPKKKGSVVKRVIGLPGDEITPRDSTYNEGLPLFIPSGYVWVEGDNANNSIDSNQYGLVPVGYVVGQVTRILLPQDLSQSSRLLRPIRSYTPEPRRIYTSPLFDPRYADIGSSSSAL